MPRRYTAEYELICSRIDTLFADTLELMRAGDTDAISALRRQCDEIKDTISDTYHHAHDQLRDGDTAAMAVLYVYVNMLQETQEMVSSIRKYLRALPNCETRSSAPAVLREAAQFRNIDITVENSL